jgi:hypothetical protein
MTGSPLEYDFDFDETPEGSEMNANTQTIDVDVDGIQSIGQASRLLSSRPAAQWRRARRPQSRPWI